MRPVSWSPEAIRDVVHIHDHLAQFNPAAATSIAAELYGSTDVLIRFPELGRPAADDTRELVVRQQYVVVGSALCLGMMRDDGSVTINAQPNAGLMRMIPAQ